MTISKRHFLFGVIFGIVLLFAYLFTLPDGKLQIVFCDVGQGDAAYIKTASNQDMLIDGGPNNRVLECLGKYMPFYDRTIDVVMLSHPQKDHLQGLITVLERYIVNYIVIGVEGNDTEGYKRLVQVINEKKIPVKNLYTGDVFYLGETKFSILWPERKWVADKTQNSNVKTQILTGKEAVLGITTETDLNDFSYYVHLQFKDFDALFTGDGDRRIQPEIRNVNKLPDVEVLKLPHHGSKTGILSEFLDAIRPELAIISVGKNSYGHPTQEALKLLKDKNIVVKRTDLEGNIVITTDGSSWNL